MAVYKRLRLKASGSTVRMAKPLRVDRRVRTLAKNPHLASGLISCREPGTWTGAVEIPAE